MASISGRGRRILPAAAIAGATAWAQASPPAPTAKSSALNSYLKLKGQGLTSANIADGSLLYKDFQKYQVPSYKMFQKAELSRKHFQKVEIDRVYPKVEIDRNFLKIKDADARYVKIDDVGSKVVMGDGSVLTATKLVAGGQSERLLDVAGKFTVDATGPTIRITNTGSSPLIVTTCGAAGSATLGTTEHTDCDDTDSAHAVQLIGTDGSVATLNFSAVQVPGGTQSTVQVLIGL